MQIMLTAWSDVFSRVGRLSDCARLSCSFLRPCLSRTKWLKDGFALTTLASSFATRFVPNKLFSLHFKMRRCLPCTSWCLTAIWGLQSVIAIIMNVINTKRTRLACSIFVVVIATLFKSVCPTDWLVSVLGGQHYMFHVSNNDAFFCFTSRCIELMLRGETVKLNKTISIGRKQDGLCTNGGTSLAYRNV